MRYEQSGKRVFSAPLSRAREGTNQSIGSRNSVRIGKRLGIAGFYFFMAKGVLWLIGLSFVYGFGL